MAYALGTSVEKLSKLMTYNPKKEEEEVDVKRPLSFTTPRGTKVKEKGMTIFEMARCGDCDGINELIERGQDVNERFFTGWTALMDASMCGQAEAVKLLLAKGADKEMKNTNGFTALMLAPNKQIVDLLNTKATQPFDNVLVKTPKSLAPPDPQHLPSGLSRIPREEREKIQPIPRTLYTPRKDGAGRTPRTPY